MSGFSRFLPSSNSVAGAVALALAACAVTPAYAQDQSAGEEGLSEVVVTGSRIIREGMSSPTPVTAMTADELIQNNPQSISQALAELPSMTNSTTPQSMGGRTTLGPGSFLNLRNLGTNRNLVLLDGRRVVPSNVAGNTDINLLPQGLVSNIDVVTGGASAAYGSDAVAGVTNFTLNTRFEGLKVEANYGASSHDGDGDSSRVAVAWGAPFLDGKLHLIGSFDWRDSKQAYKENRDWADQFCAIVPVPGVTPANMSPTNPRQTLACGVTQPNASYGGAIISGPLVTPNQGISFGPGGVPQPFNYGTLRTTNLQVGGSGNFVGDTANFSTPTDNKVFFGRATYEVTESVEAFVQGTYGLADSVYTQTPPYFFGTNTSPGQALTIYSGNPFIPASIQARMTAQNIPSFALHIVPKSWGTIDIESTYRAWDAVAGLKGEFGDTWKWDAYYENGRTAFKLDYSRQISLSRLYRAADAVVAPNGTIVCQSALANPAAYGNCVPLNPFGDGAPSQAALDYIHSDFQPQNYNIMHQQVAAASISGEPFSSWAGPVAVGGGVEWRKLEGEITSDIGSYGVGDQAAIRGLPLSLVNRPGDWSTSNVQPLQGDYNVKEAFVETLVPLARELPALESLDLNGAFRYTDYSQSGSVHTWKVGLTWKPISEVMIRATRSRDIRAPGIGDLYSRDSMGPNTIVNTPTGSVSAPILLSGNPTLKPEEADTKTYGITYQPDWLSGFAASADYYDISIEDALQTVSAQETVDRCTNGQQVYCDNLIRAGGTIVGIRQRTMNLSEARTRGVDLDFTYRTQISGANTTFRLLGTRLLEQSTTVPNATGGATYVDRVGDMSLGYPKWLLIGSTNVSLGAFGFNVNARYIDGGRYNTTYLPGDIDPKFADVASNLTFDVGARYGFASMTGSPEVYVNIANVFDRDPPLIPSSALVGGQTNVALYDTLGRYYTAGVRLQF